MIKFKCGSNGIYDITGIEQLPESRKAVKKPIPVLVWYIMEPFIVETLEGTMCGKPGNWLIQGVKGELYSCDNEIFRNSYKIIED